jgi:hypothetical protein
MRDEKEEEEYQLKLKMISEYKFDTKLSEYDKYLIKGPIETIRYFVLPNLPNII